MNFRKTKKIKYITHSIVFLITILLFSCESSEKNNQLHDQRILLENDVHNLQKQKVSLQNDISMLTEKNKELIIYASGKTPKYILKLHLKQSHISFSIK